MSGNEFLFKFNLKITLNNKYFNYAIFYLQLNTFTVLVPGLVTIEFLLLIKS
jgi:hypothetical protein